jgi:ADP-ribosylglycohydrolase
METIIGSEIDERTYLQKVYAGILGKIIGVRLGAPVEPLFWTADKIYEAYGEIKGYIKSYKNFAADDDINGPLFFVRSVEDVCLRNGGSLTAKDIGDAWLNYTAEGHGMFWWGGYGTSTEHTAYINLQNGILPPDSGSIAKNGEAIAEQIGGQIFVDSWGLVCPGDPERAALYAGLAASVSHDRNAVFGGQFIAACISLAFTEKDIETVYLKALQTIPDNSGYAMMAKDIYRVWQENPTEWRKTWEYIKQTYSDKKYPGIVHIIPNGAVVVCALLHGGGDFSKTVTIATMCGWDTDCNAGNIGTILGVFKGLEGIEERWRLPIGDFVVASSVIGSENNLDIPSVAQYFAHINHLLYARPYDPKTTRFDRSIRFDFSLPGATHGMRSFPENRVTVRNSDCIDSTAERRLLIRSNFVVRNSEFRVFYKPFYRRKDFDDERYIPNFSPTVYPGQVLHTVIETGDIVPGQDIMVKPYIQDTDGKQWVGERLFSLENKTPLEITFPIPAPLEGAVIEEVGLKIYNSGRESFYGNIAMSEFRIDGKAHYTIDPTKQTIEFGTVTPFTWHKGYWSLPDRAIQGICSDEGNLYTGSLHWKDFIYRSTIQVPFGEQAYLLCRVHGNQRYYCFGFNKGEAVALAVDSSWRSPLKKKFLQRLPYAWKANDRYLMEIETIGDVFVFRVNGQPLITFTDSNAGTGMVGYRIESGTRLLIHTFEFVEL